MPSNAPPASAATKTHPFFMTPAQRRQQPPPPQPQPQPQPQTDLPSAEPAKRPRVIQQSNFFTKKTASGKQNSSSLKQTALSKCGRESAPWPNAQQLAQPSVVSEATHSNDYNCSAAHNDDYNCSMAKCWERASASARLDVIDYFSLQKVERRPMSKVNVSCIANANVNVSCNANANAIANNTANTSATSNANTQHFSNLLNRIAGKLRTNYPLTQTFLIHGPTGFGKTHFATHILPTALNRRLLLLDASQLRTPKSFDPIHAHLQHSRPSQVVLVVDALECLFGEWERGFPGALTAFLASVAGQERGLLVLLTSQWGPGMLSECANIRLPFNTESIRVGAIGCVSDCVSASASATTHTTPSTPTTPTTATHTTELSSVVDELELLSSSSSSVRPVQLRQPFTAFEADEPTDEMLWHHQIPSQTPTHSVPDQFHWLTRHCTKNCLDHSPAAAAVASDLARRLARRFFDYSRAAHRLSLWLTAGLLQHVRDIERYWAAAAAAAAAADGNAQIPAHRMRVRTRRRLPYYKYVLDDAIHAELLATSTAPCLRAEE